MTAQGLSCGREGQWPGLASRVSEDPKLDGGQEEEAEGEEGFKVKMYGEKRGPN